MVKENKRLIDDDVYEIGVDEAGRGPLFGRVYAAAVILPISEQLDCSMMKDSKRFTSVKKINEVAEYIKENALAWAVAYEDEKTIDKINIRQATFKAMHSAIRTVIKKINSNNIRLIIDGNDFKPYMAMIKNNYQSVPHTCIEGGDDKISCISAASILAKVERDEYINKLCTKNPKLSACYGIDTNKGYGTKKHIDGIKEHGITEWHRKSYGICKNHSN